MKQRPRRAENGIARELNEIFLPLGYSEIKRIPVLGRDGPDLTINETGLVVDVKSRQQCPSTYFCVETLLITNGHPAMGLVAIQILPEVSKIKTRSAFHSRLVSRWLAHMDEWREKEYPNGTSVIVLHRPGLPYGKAMAAFYLSDIGKIIQIFASKE